MSLHMRTVVVLGTGGTIAGTGAPGAQDHAYQAAQLGVAELLAPWMSAPGWTLEAQQVAQLDSKDMDHAVWLNLAIAAQAALNRPEVAGVVITHGTDTVEETAVFLHEVLRTGGKPVVLTCAMRPSTSEQADGPAHLAQSWALVTAARARGVLVVFAGQAWAATAVRKRHPFALDAIGGGDEAPLARWDGQAWRHDAATVGHDGPGRGAEHLPPSVADWPRVAVLPSHAGVEAWWVEAGLNAGVQGWVVSGTGNGSFHRVLESAFDAAQRAGRLRREQVLVCTRCLGGSVVGQPPHGWPVAASLTPPQARAWLMVQLMRR